VELTPRTAPGAATSAAARRRRSPWAYAVLAVVLVAVGVVAYQGLTTASLYFYEADEAVQQRDELGTKRIRLMGAVVDKEEPAATGVTFDVTWNDVTVEIHHDGAVPQLFAPGTPVVVVGHWAESGSAFESDEILVKHDEEYEAENGDRLEDAEDGERGGPSAP
jgi:cytochrome c-type biogenesis protein CcmE